MSYFDSPVRFPLRSCLHVITLKLINLLFWFIFTNRRGCDVGGKKANWGAFLCTYKNRLRVTFGLEFMTEQKPMSLGTFNGKMSKFRFLIILTANKITNVLHSFWKKKHVFSFVRRGDMKFFSHLTSTVATEGKFYFLLFIPGHYLASGNQAVQMHICLITQHPWHIVCICQIDTFNLNMSH